MNHHYGGEFELLAVHVFLGTRLAVYVSFGPCMRERIFIAQKFWHGLLAVDVSLDRQNLSETIETLPSESLFRLPEPPEQNDLKACFSIKNTSCSFSTPCIFLGTPEEQILMQTS